MYNVPPKFNQICRLCLTVVEPKGTSLIDNGEIVKKLSIFHNKKNKADKQNNQFNDDVRDDDQLNKKVKRSNEISISLSGGSASVINNGFSSSNDIDDDSDWDISKRILQCLSIKVSHLFFHFAYSILTCVDENVERKTHGDDGKLRFSKEGPQNILCILK
jgi:hypothetical protein